MSILFKTIYRLSAILIEIPVVFFTEKEQGILKFDFVWNHKRIPDGQSSLEKEKHIWVIMLPDLKVCYRAIIIKTLWYWHIDTCVGQQNRIESPEIHTCM